MTRAQRIRRAEERVLWAAEKWEKDVGLIVWSTEGNLIAALRALQRARKAAK
jgi:hypothetical protein